MKRLKWYTPAILFLLVSTDSITVNDMARLSYFTKAGDFKNAVKTPCSPFTGGLANL